ncbi:MAG: hypothetical protein RR806_08540, partial [Oscillospiraceae bacterium]
RIIVRQRVYNNFAVEEIQAVFPNLPLECQSFLLTISEKESLRTAVEICEIAVEFATHAKQKLTCKIMKDTYNQLFLGVGI